MSMKGTHRVECVCVRVFPLPPACLFLHCKAEDLGRILIKFYMNVVSLETMLLYFPVLFNC